MSASQTSPENIRRIGGVTMAGKCARNLLPLGQKRHRNKTKGTESSRSFYQAYSTPVSGYLWRGLVERLKRLLAEIARDRFIGNDEFTQSQYPTLRTKLLFTTFRELQFSAIRSLLDFVTVVVTLGRRSCCRVVL